MSDVKNLKIGKETEPVDLSEFVGKKTTIEKITTDWFSSKFHEGGRAKCVKIETDVITTIKVEGKDTDIRASELLNLKQDRSGDWVISPNKDSNIQKFMNHFGVTHPKDLFGKECVVTLRPKKSATSGQDLHFLGIEY